MTDPAATQPAEQIPAIQRRFERMLASSRLLILLPVVMLLLIAAGTFVYGAFIFFASITGYLHDPARVGGKLSHFLIVEDLFLVGVTLMISAFGFYGLFVVRNERHESQYWLPRWLQMHDLEDLKARVVSMLILVAAMTFVDVVVEFQDGKGILYLGIGVALVIVALTAFLRFGRQGHAAAADADPAAATAAADDAPGPTGHAARPGAAGPDDSPDVLAHDAAVPALEASGSGQAGGGTAAQDAGPVPRRGRIVALLGATRRDGAWNVGSAIGVIAAAGGARLDLRDAVLPAGQVTIRAIAALGRVSITIPPEMRVADSGIAFLGGRSISGAAAPGAGPARPDAPLLVLTGACVLGLVQVRRRPRDQHVISP